MWLLRDSNGKIRYLKPGTSEEHEIVKIGRRQSDIVLENDTSISRAHATIEVILKEETNVSERTSTCIVKDANSKYGTHIIRNEVKVKASADGFELQPSDTLQFGLQHHVFKVEYIPIVSVISRLTDEHQKQLKLILKKIGGLVTNTFDNNCTYLTATTARCTTKIISAIIAGIPVININFWPAVLKAIENNESFPDPAGFTLPLQDKGINPQRVSLKPNPLRKSLFQGKTFIFFSEKVCNEYNKMIENAGGKAELYNGSFRNIPEKLFANDNLVMQVTTESLTDDLAAFNTLVYDKMQEKKLRMISETEIPLAILYVSLDQYCNPKHHFKDLIKRKSLKKDESKILALDTQDIVVTTNNELETKQVVCIPETQPKDETNLDVVSPQFHSENNLSDDIVQSNNPSTSDKKLVNTVVNMDSNFKEKRETNESSDFGNRTNVNFRLKRPSDTALESDESKKRAKGKTSNDEMNKNVQNIWKSKKFANSSTETKKESSLLTKSKHDFDELEHKSQIKEKKQDKLSKWGFKKIAKKSIDFDLDDFEEDEIKVEVSQKTVTSVRNSNRESEITLVETIESQKPSKTLESYQGNKNLQAKSFNDNKSFKENMDKNWTAFKAPKSTISKSNLSTDNGSQRSLLVRPSIKVEETDDDARKGSKTFKKVNIVIPIKRIALADMTVWRPNS